MNVTRLKIRIYADPCLRKKSLPIEHVGPAERLLIQSMIATMNEHKGVGLAAPQVGINQRIFVMDIGQGPTVIINPRIVRKSGSAVMEEGCLSIPGVTVKIKRPDRIWVKYSDEFDHDHERSFHDLMARVILHENDHLNGKLILDYLSLTERRKAEKQLKETKDKPSGDK